jgi:hypothetical protein
MKNFRKFPTIEKSFKVFNLWSKIVKNLYKRSDRAKCGYEDKKWKMMENYCSSVNKIRSKNA